MTKCKWNKNVIIIIIYLSVLPIVFRGGKSESNARQASASKQG